MAKSEKTTKKTDDLIISGSLAVRERPINFGGIVGQKSIISQLRGAIKKRKLPGTILLHGPAGCGKTTLARVFARYINCETFNACGECPSCKQSIDSHQDITEINMARATGKAEAEALIDKSRYSPRFRVRVFILDEFHQVSSHAENVFLKPFEEPPPGTLWILCTSEPEKLKNPTMSRCLKLKVEMASVDELSDRLQVIAKREGMDLSDKSGVSLTKTMANYANGQVREAISLLESVILAHAGNKKADLKDVVENFARSMESTVDKAAARCTVAFIKGNIKAICTQASSIDSCRQLLMKMRWVAMGVIDDFSGNLKFKSYAFKDFQELLKAAEIRYDFKELVPKMLGLLHLLNSIEVLMNQANIDEKALFLSEVCNYVYLKRSSK